MAMTYFFESSSMPFLFIAPTLSSITARCDAVSHAAGRLRRILHQAIRHMVGLGRRIDGLANFPERGSSVKELLLLGTKDFRQVSFKPYRIVYRVIESTVYALVVADGRRDMQALLMRRLLRD